MTRCRVVPWCDFYRVGDDGSVWSCRVPRSKSRRGEWVKLNPTKDTAGYLQVWLYTGGGRKSCQVHKLVMEVFKGACPEGMECLHKDNDKANCRLGNLKYGTRLENMRQASADGLLDKVSTVNQRRAIFVRVVGGERMADLAREFGLPYGLVKTAVRKMRKTEPTPPRVAKS